MNILTSKKPNRPEGHDPLPTSTDTTAPTDPFNESVPMHAIPFTRPVPRTSPTPTHRRNLHRLAAAAAAVVCVSVVGIAPTASAAKRPPPTKPTLKAVPNRACAPLGARAPGTSLDCVNVGSKTLWEPKGSKLDPYRPGETFEWTQSTNGNEAGADTATKRIVVRDYLPDATSWVNNFTDNQPQDIYTAASGAPLRGVRVDYTLVHATDPSSRNLGSLSSFWLGDDADAGCCNEGLLQWGIPPDVSLDAYSSLDDGTTRTGVMLFARTNAQLGTKPLMRLSWDDIRTAKRSYIYFAMS